MPRLVHRAYLHPDLRAVLPELEQRLRDAEIPLELYETVRSPWRQGELFARGRTTGVRGKTSTEARAWESSHQYGAALDMVFRVAGKWRWKEPKAGMWDEYHRIARGLKLRPLQREKPHVELPVSRADWQAGRGPAGDEPWRNWIEDQAERWGRAARDIAGQVHPGAPEAVFDTERPALEDIA